ncbi:MAG TPA: hypothetical protein VFV19_17805 [Candidatus Polarisedimenticolaceae bacterium]|nr:hypothetical protein [Candidatus Polarisedimenticolaceae bacterium]
MSTKRAGDAVKAGFYFNFRTWEIHLHKTSGDALPGSPDERYTRIPAVALLLLGPVMGFFFVIFLPLIGFALVAREIGRRALALLGRKAEVKPKPVSR